MIALLVGYIFHATVNRIAKVEDDYRQMMELKKRAEAADVAKSQVYFLQLNTSGASCLKCVTFLLSAFSKKVLILPFAVFGNCFS